MGKKLSIESVRKTCLSFGFEFLDEEYFGSSFKHNFKCLKHNSVHTCQVDCIKRGQRLKCCRYSNMRLNISFVKEECLKRGIEFLDNYYKNSGFKHSLKCIKHNKIHKCPIYPILNKGRGLSCCSIERSKLTIDDVRKECARRGFELLTKNFKGSLLKYNFRCLKHNKIQTSTYSQIQQGHGLNCCGLDKKTGENHYGWKPNLTTKQRELSRRRGGTLGLYWARNVKNRDNHTCQICKSKNNLHAHHLESFMSNKKLRYEIENGVTLCIECHMKFHHKYGKTNNTKHQFNRFKALK